MMDEPADLSVEPFRIVRAGDDIELRGEFDVAVAPDLEAVVARLVARRIDVSGVTFCDGRGLAALEFAEDLGWRIVGVSPAVCRVRELVGLFEPARHRAGPRVGGS